LEESKKPAIGPFSDAIDMGVHEILLYELIHPQQDRYWK